MTDCVFTRISTELEEYVELVDNLYILFEKTWLSNKNYRWQYKLSKQHSEKSLEKFMAMFVTAMCQIDDWYLCYKYIDIVGGNWQRSLFELVGMFIRIKVGE